MVVRLLTIIIIQWIEEKRAATAIEYGLIASGIALAIILAVVLTGTSLQDIFNALFGKISEAQALVN